MQTLQLLTTNVELTAVRPGELPDLAGPVVAIALEGQPGYPVDGPFRVLTYLDARVAVQIADGLRHEAAKALEGSDEPTPEPSGLVLASPADARAVAAAADATARLRG